MHDSDQIWYELRIGDSALKMARNPCVKPCRDTGVTHGGAPTTAHVPSGIIPTPNPSTKPDARQQKPPASFQAPAVHVSWLDREQRDRHPVLRPTSGSAPAGYATNANSATCLASCRWSRVTTTASCSIRVHITECNRTRAAPRNWNNVSRPGFSISPKARSTAKRYR